MEEEEDGGKIQFLGRFTDKQNRVPRTRRTDRPHVRVLSLKWPQGTNRESEAVGAQP